MNRIIVNRTLVKRSAVYVIGVLIMSFGISVTVRASIGSAPSSSVALAISKLTPLSIGWSTSLLHMFWVVVQLAVTRRPTVKLLAQFPFSYVFGRLVDLFYWLMRSLSTESLPISLAELIVGMLIFSLGIRAIVGSDLLLTPPDAAARMFGGMFGWPMSKSKLIFDIFMTAAAALMMLAFKRNVFTVVGIGTVICTAGTGPAIGLFTKLLPFLDVRKDAAAEQSETETPVHASVVPDTGQHDTGETP